MSDAGSDASKSHKPSPKRIKEFRKRGEVALSRDLTAAITLGLGIAGLLLGGAAAWSTVCASTRVAMSGAPLDEVAIAARDGFAAAVLPAMIAALLGSILGGGLQLGWPPALKKPSFDITRWFSFGGLGEMVSPSAMGRRLLTTMAKVGVIGAVVYLVISSELGSLMTLGDPRLLPARLGGAVIRLTIVATAALAALAAFDFFLSRRRLSKKMMMSSEDLKREHREAEGDPQVKGKRRRRARELAKRRLVAETKGADVVLVNPTHYAVALKYDTKKDGAPRVVAKGTDEVAARIREAARSAGVPVISRPPLARALHKLVPEGKEIPHQLFNAVAEVLAYVYRLKQPRRAS